VVRVPRPCDMDALAPRRRCRWVPSAGCVATGDRCLVPQGAGAPTAISVPGSEGPGRVAAFAAPGPRATGATPPSAGARGPPGPRTGGPPLNKSTFQTNLCGRKTGFRIVAVPIRGRGIVIQIPKNSLYLPYPRSPKVGCLGYGASGPYRTVIDPLPVRARLPVSQVPDGGGAPEAYAARRARSPRLKMRRGKGRSPT
jgi:hypothetical protein